MSKVTVITGGTSGIGRGIAEKILANSREGDTLYISYGHNQQQAEQFYTSLSPENQKMVVLVQADMSSYEEMMAFAGKIKEEAGQVDWLINNVGISTYDKYEDYTFEEWSKIVNTNLSVPVFLVKELRPVMKEGGSILFTGSYAGVQAYSSSLVYGVTKAPGFIETSWHKNRTPESYERINRKIALHRFGEISEVADMAYEILKNGYMNGSIVDIHGGYDYF